MRQRSWYAAIPSNWTVGVSDNGWTTNELGLHWVKNVFNHFTKDHTTGAYRLLILDGHGSHTAVDFHDYCYQNNIITLCMPAHSSHYLQPLDVSCFATLKRIYGQQVLDQMRLGINFIEKDDFLELYQAARPLAFTCSSIQNGFRASGLVPLNPNEVLERLLVDISNRLATPPPQLPNQPTQTWLPGTPHNIIDLTQQSTAVGRLIRYNPLSPPSPTVRAIAQLTKGCQLAMHQGIILANENAKLRAANEKIKKKRMKRTTYVGRGGASTGAEGLGVHIETENTMEEAFEVVEAVEAPAPLRALRQCSICRSTQHTARTCSERQ